MPWREVSAMDERREFVRLAMMEGVNRRELCRRFGISPDVGYKWLRRAEAGDEALVDRSRRPATSPGRTVCEVEAAVLAERDAHPAWGARKIARRLAGRGIVPPAVSTAHAILARHGRIAPPARADKALGRFERAAPNELWQMDFKGWVRLTNGQICHPLTVIDDHSRFSPCVQACADQRGDTVRSRLSAVFRRYGLPQALFVDNGPPWGFSGDERWTRFGVWLLKLGIDVVHSRPYHPQGRGKNERFHRTLKAEVLALNPLADLDKAQRAFDRWREVYNFERPHEALDLEPPAGRWRPSSRPMPEALPEVRYDEDELVRRVWPTKACISFRGRTWRVPRAFQGEPVAVRPLDRDGRYGIFFGSRRIANIDLTCPGSVSHVSEQPSVMSPV